MFDEIKPGRVTVTVKAQLPQGLQVYRFFTQGCFKFLDPERSSSVTSDWRTRRQPGQAHSGGFSTAEAKGQPGFLGLQEPPLEPCSSGRRWEEQVAPLWCRLATSSHTGAGWPPVHILVQADHQFTSARGDRAWPSTKAANDQGWLLSWSVAEAQVSPS